MNNSCFSFFLHRFLSLMALGIVMLFLSCRPSPPFGVMSEDDLEDLLYDYNLAVAMANNALDNDSIDREALRYQYVQRVFLKHGVSEERFDSSMVWYSSEGSSRLLSIFQRLNERLDAEAKTLGVGLSETELYASYGMDGDTANVWSGAKIVFVTNRQPDNVRIFSLPIDSTYLPGDTYKLSFNAHFLPAQGSHSVYTLFSVCYADSSVVSAVQCVGGDYRVELNLSPNERQDTLLPQSVTLSFYAPPSSSRDNQTQLFCMTFPSVLRMHKPHTEDDDLKDDIVLPSDSGSIASTDSLYTDSLTQTTERRLSPLEERDKREERHDIEIVKERITKPNERTRVRRRVQ